MRFDESCENSAPLLNPCWSHWNFAWKPSNWYLSSPPPSSSPPLPLLLIIISFYLSLLSTGYEAYPNVVGIVVGLITIFIITYFLAKKVDSNTTDKVSSTHTPTHSTLLSYSRGDTVREISFKALGILKNCLQKKRTFSGFTLDSNINIITRESLKPKIIFGAVQGI
jgi:hypothetical protein